MTIRYNHIGLEAAKASAREAALARKTCEGCAALQTWPRPQCKGETSPHFRQVRDTYHERCPAYAVAFRQVEQEPKPEPAPKPHVRLVMRGRVTR